MEPVTKPAPAPVAKRASKTKGASARQKQDPRSKDAVASKLAIIIRLRGISGVKNTLNVQMAQMHLTRRYHACLMSRPIAFQKAQQVKDYVAWGEAEEAALEKLLSARLQLNGKHKPDEKYYAKLGVTNGAAGLASALIAGKVTPKQMELAGARPFFTLHPPRKGLEGIKGAYPKQSLGYYGSHINALAVRMV
jgi:50S ribosomal protein uL30